MVVKPALEREERMTSHLAIWPVAGAEAERRGHSWWKRGRKGFQTKFGVCSKLTNWSKVCGKLSISKEELKPMP